MLRKFLPLPLFFYFLFLLSSCETDVDVNAEWEEITIVYGLLDQTDEEHIFRINKAFLGGNALEIAQIADSSSYNGAQEVVLQGLLNGEVEQTIVFDTTTIADKDSGIFYNPYMLVYKGTGQLNSNYQYRLNIKNTITGKEVSASTRLIQEFTISQPPSGGRATFRREFTSPFAWKNAVNAKRYEPVLRFHYFEVVNGNNDTIPKYIDWALPSKFADDVSGTGLQEIDINNNGFYEVIKNKVQPDEINGHRLCGTVDFIVTAGGEEYDTYMRVNGPSNSLVQDRPEYTNVENGFGLVSSRVTVVKNRRLSTLTEDEILLLERDFITNPDL
jgi:hypothetical protein